MLLLWLLWKPFKTISDALRNDRTRHTQTSSRQQTSQAPKQPDEKDEIVPDGAGEYIDYEEVKDDSSLSG
ncbi:MAG: hypothetical protein J6H19_06925 [Bacteroidaceae bacterium]|nr:hypothetical protein [Bacteroidaceae bacterium]